jgi:vacuolar protein 8
LVFVSGCPTSSDDNKNKIAKSGALVPLTRLARSKDMRVQRNATGALLNMTHSDENRQQLVAAGAIPVLVGLLNSEDTDVQYYCTTALSNIAVDCQSLLWLGRQLVSPVADSTTSDSL